MSYVWFGDFRAMYIELGQLTPAKRNHPQGELTVYAGYHWKGAIEKPHGAEILGEEILGIEVLEGANLVVQFSNGIRLETDVEGGEPEWCISVRDCTHLSVKEGRLHMDAASVR
ncbi:MAG: hypothetical protein C0449_00240 [Polaromonas sp.]|nr:hypothetical protein [Polaromonas sp.]